jgi:hypothetical protein
MFQRIPIYRIIVIKSRLLKAATFQRNLQVMIMQSAKILGAQPLK